MPPQAWSPCRASPCHDFLRTYKYTNSLAFDEQIATNASQASCLKNRSATARLFAELIANRWEFSDTSLIHIAFADPRFLRQGN